MAPVTDATLTDNACMYKDFVPILELVQYPYIHQVWPSGLRKSLRLYPKYLQWGLACVTINHQMHRLETQDSSHFKALAKKFYEYRGIALCSLNEQLTELSLVDQRTSDMVLAGILTLLLIDIHHDTSTGWRNHLVGLQQLLTLRGGLEQLARSENLAPLLLCFWFISVISNTTCPASDLVATGWHLAKSNVVLERYRSNVGIFQLCPPALFTTIIELSHLRLRVTQQAQSSTGAENLADEGYDILNRVHSFSPEHWARSKPSLPEDWILIATIYQCSIALYCVSSLQSLSVFPSTLELRAVCAAHGRTLRSRLSVGLASPKTSRFLLWPLVLLGVEAVHGDAEMRAFVVAQLQLLSRDVGTFIPIAAKNVLESFWDSGDTRWDACFDRAYAFTTHIAVDNSRIAC